MRFPKYQWMQEQPISYGYCDEVVIPDDIIPEFQVISDSSNVISEEFTANPFDEITSTTMTFVYDVNIFTSTGLQFYINDNVYILEVDLTNTTGDYTYTKIGNTYFVKIAVGLGAASPGGNVRDFFVDIVDVNEGTTTTYAVISETVTIANVPAGSYFNNYGTATSITGVTASVNKGKYFYYNTDRVVYKNINESTLGIAFYEFQMAINAGNSVVTIPVIVGNSMDIEVTLDDGTNPPVTYPFTLVAGQSEISFPHTSLLTSTHTVKIEITDTTYRDGLIVKSFNVTTPQTIDNIQVEDCDGTITDIDFDVEYDDKFNYKISITGVLPSPKFRLYITDSDENIIVSRWYKVYQSDECRTYIRLSWSNNCDFDEIKYSALPFFNDILVTGTLIKGALDDIESVSGVSTSGRKIMIYRNTQESFELNLHPYLEETMRYIERAFDHNILRINGKEYTATEPFKTSEIDMYIYTGSVELNLDDSAIISAKCCC